VSDKAERVHSIFSEIAPKYDLANDVISFGVARSWRNKLVKLSGANTHSRVLDVATGTGDLAIAFKKTALNGEVIGVDFCANMLAPAPKKAQDKNLKITFKQGDAMALEFQDGEFDIVSIAYGLRNVSDAAGAIKEMSRVIKPGGKLMILETGRSTMPLFSGVFNFYFAKVMPFFGGLLTGSQGAYQYLDASSKDFPFGDKLVELLKSAGDFKTVHAHPLFGGISYIYECHKA
jgi:demethylmenaquinone methyltransferase / 2-methoxy-6-polyprenyl-1,4-benzoquinol methylase